MEQGSGMLPLLFGAAIIVYFAHDRFTLASFETQSELERLHHLLSVDRMRTTSVVRLSMVFYTLGLLVIYFLMTAYVYIFPKSFAALTASAPQEIGGNIPGIEAIAGGSTAIPLGVALVIVGIGPSFPYVKNIESWLRGAAHRLAGIPTKILNHALALRKERFSVDARATRSFLPTADLDIIRGLEQENPDQFVDDLMLISAVAEWVLRRHLAAGDPRIRQQFLKMESVLLDRKSLLFRRIRALKKGGVVIAAADPLAAATAPGDPDAAPQPAAEAASPTASWESLTAEADQLADDICLLLALYREHGIIRPPRTRRAKPDETATDTPAAGRPHPRPAAALARERVESFVASGDMDVDHGARSAEMALLAMSWTLGVVVILTVLWAAFPGGFEYQITFPNNPARGKVPLSSRIWNQLGLSLAAYVVPVAVAVAIWQGATAAASWKQGLQDHWTRALPRALMLFFAGWLVGTFLICGINLWGAYARHGWAGQAEVVWKSVVYSFGYNAPSVLRGAFLAVLVVECLDWHWHDKAHDAAASGRSRRSNWPSFGRAGFAALVVGTAGGLTRWLTILFVIGLATASRRDVDSYDRGLIAYATLFSVLISFTLIFGLSEALRQRDRERAGRAGGSAPQPPASPDASAGGWLKKITGRSALALIPMASALLWAAGAGQAAGDRIRIGVRTDAMPYVWRDGDSDAYRGYLWDVCTSLAVRAGFDFDAEELTPQLRQQLLAGSESDVDLLCDPTTMTLTRVETLDLLAREHPGEGRLSFSPIYHIANSSYIERSSRAEKPDGAAAEAAGCPMAVVPEAAATKEEAPEPWLHLWLAPPAERPAAETAGDAPSEATAPTWGAVVGTTSADRLARLPEITASADQESHCGPFVANHARAADLFCAGVWTRYYGDEELIKAAVAALPQPCGYEIAPDNQRSYEPYAFVVSTRRIPDLDHRITAALYGMATDCSLVQKLRAHFPDASISPSLEILLKILKLPAGQRVCDPDAERQP